ncbi:4-hydroxy-tetrahydrodipicolinate reductase [Philodulcilactobacillus myokoensis]|uniref:4-hydroxy-tetrahydrodipicolinate reductase n=1 Tax=Philodulcilactobacillus myokoensis TaxID=2929573 RepID=A0A9W6B031_9LACO|nr:4-hydroxy-tetrahydrodipicolinate reductase [Philodulcilactobacillus myokoensis]GLB46534.1 4-hydroxy-tetrahydrodipicolinate reductase [Philodulcilactobacillus myokoensis]
MIKVLVAGFTGAMGQKAVHMVNTTDNFKLVGAYAPSAKKINRKDYHLDDDVKIYSSLNDIDSDADVWIDFTLPSSVYENTKFAIQHHIQPVVGTSGLSDDQINSLVKLSKQEKVGGLVAPNFGLSAVLLMKFAQSAAKYFPDAEIIEMHHGDKADAPSGTALNTAKLIDQVRPRHEQGAKHPVETLKNVRGGDYHGIRIHAVRLPGYIAHEQVLFGGPGEALTIRQDSFDRGSFMKGVKVAVNKVDSLDHLIVGLENVL